MKRQPWIFLALLMGLSVVGQTASAQSVPDIASELSKAQTLPSNSDARCDVGFIFIGGDAGGAWCVPDITSELNARQRRNLPKRPAVGQTAPAQTPDYNQIYRLTQAQNLASMAIDGCYQNKDLYQCEKLNQIKATLLTWASQGDKNASATLAFIISIEGAVQANETLRNSGY
ncbi:hypothetical protein LEP3755_50160 [Leptolyngbya sp. NIES-3755]|nr:hypothetical protein LEP3755_50160 [Leptolyngbya sp. NIES-3755]